MLTADSNGQVEGRARYLLPPEAYYSAEWYEREQLDGEQWQVLESTSKLARHPHR